MSDFSSRHKRRQCQEAANGLSHPMPRSVFANGLGVQNLVLNCSSLLPLLYLRVPTTDTLHRSCRSSIRVAGLELLIRLPVVDPRLLVA